MSNSQYDPKGANLAVIAGKSVFLGGVFSVNLLLAFTGGNLPIHAYLMFWSTFHFLEFMSTCLYNNLHVDDDSFILEDLDVHIMNIFALVEYLARSWFGWRYFNLAGYLGLAVLLLGQCARTLAMCTARESFNHYVQRKHETSTHKLVTTGIYNYSRHPSYFGFWWWFIGMQLLLNNVFVLIAGSCVLYKFFSKRIRFEEIYLVEFFKEDYLEYRRKTRTWIPFIY